MQAVRAFVRRAAEVDASVLLTGETGTGKSLAARLIHQSGERSSGPYVVVNCAGVPESLFESELFGHERGAFTGATAARTGLVEAASGGTLFLDEVGDLPVAQQSKLLTVLEERTVRPIGSVKSRPVELRLVSGTGADLEAALEAGSFRRDLFHRLAVLRCWIPPLRERPEDALHLARRFLRRLGRRYGLDEVRLSPDGASLVESYAWPGNVRELAHALEAAVILGRSRVVTADTLREAAKLR
jgi:transcriptional regulator with PAS, ATPase and Fis domain